jgi:hypothetical protein
MKLISKTALSTLAIVLSAVTSASSQTADSLPSTDDVIAKMLHSDAERRSQLTGYTALRRYTAVNGDRQAEVVVRVDCASDGAKQFTMVSEEGSRAIRKHVFYKMLSEETMASRREAYHTGKLQVQHSRARHSRHRSRIRARDYSKDSEQIPD